MPTFTISVNTKPLGTYVVKKAVISIGRSRTNTISIASKAVSRNHVRIEQGTDGWSLSDLGSLNGTYVNDIRITSASLSEGDKITVGAYSILFSPEPLPLASQGDGHISDVASDDSDGSDTDVRLESASAIENPVEPGSNGLDNAMVNIAPPQQTTTIPTIPGIASDNNVSDIGSHELDTNRLSNLIPSGSGESPHKAGYNAKPGTLQDKVKLAICENPLADDAWIKNRLAEGDLGESDISKQKLLEVLKEMNLDTQIKRYQYFMHS